mgnify:FL=1
MLSVNLKRTLQPPIRTIQLSLAALWIYQGLVPKILFQAQDELRIWLLQGFDAGLALRLMQLSGASAGQTVPHVHFHLIPSSVHELGRHAAQMGDQDKIKAQAEKIKAVLAEL